MGIHRCRWCVGVRRSRRLRFGIMSGDRQFAAVRRHRSVRVWQLRHFRLLSRSRRGPDGLVIVHQRISRVARRCWSSTRTSHLIAQSTWWRSQRVTLHGLVGVIVPTTSTWSSTTLLRWHSPLTLWTIRSIRRSVAHLGRTWRSLDPDTFVVTRSLDCVLRYFDHFASLTLVPVRSL